MGRSQRQQKKRHIRAAREWLGKAENSLEQQDDLQGELKLMLAKAELSQLEESAKAQRWRRRILRLLALVTAVVIAAIGIYFVPGLLPQQNAPVNTGGSETTVQTTQTEKDTQVSPQEQTETSPTSQTNAEAANEADASSAETAPLVAQEVSSESKAEVSTASEADRSAPAAENPPSVPTSQGSEASVPPDLEKQQLMQSAGKVLRQ